MEQVWTADGQEPRELRADAALCIYEMPRALPRRNWLRVAAKRAMIGAALGLAVVGLVHYRTEPLPPAPVIVESPYEADPSLAPLVALPALPHDASRYVARSRGAQGGRWDTLTSGEWTSGGMFLRVTLRQDVSPSVSLFVELAKQAAELGAAVLRSANPEVLPGAKRRVEWSEATLSDALGERSCVGFLLPITGPIRVSGLACAERGARLDQANLECLIGALSATPAGLSAGLGAALPSAASRRPACADKGA